MDILKNLNKNYKLITEIPVNKYHNSNKHKEVYFPKGISLKLVDIDFEEECLVFSALESDFLTELAIKTVDINILMFEENKVNEFKGLTKIIKCWNKTPDRFTQQTDYHSTDTYVLQGKQPVNDDEYSPLATGCGSNTYYSKKKLEKQLAKLDAKYEGEIKREKRRVKTITNQLRKRHITVPFKKYETIIELDGKIIKIKKPDCPITIDGDLLNFMLSEEYGHEVIDAEQIGWAKEMEEDISHLEGYMLTQHTDGYHNNDGDYCDYEVTLSTPDGFDYHTYNRHCLVTGWNFHGEVTFN